MTDKKGWSRFYTDKVARNYRRWPMEAVVIACFGSALSEKIRVTPSTKVLDVGCGMGNNLLPFLERGCACHGVEISREIADIAGLALADRGYRAEMSVGTNRALPYEDDVFDILISVDAIHYEGTEERVRAGLREYARVLKPGGAAIVCTTGPLHSIYREAKPLGLHRYVFGSDDFRKGQEFFYFDNERYLKMYMDEAFARTEIARSTVSMPREVQDGMIAIGRKPVGAKRGAAKKTARKAAKTRK